MALPSPLGQLRDLGVLSWSTAQMDFSTLGLLQDVQKSREGVALAGFGSRSRRRLQHWKQKCFLTRGGAEDRAWWGRHLNFPVFCFPADPDGVGAPGRRDEGDHPRCEPGPGLLGDRAGGAGGRGAVHAPARALRRGRAVSDPSPVPTAGPRGWAPRRASSLTSSQCSGGQKLTQSPGSCRKGSGGGHGKGFLHIPAPSHTLDSPRGG